MKYFVPAISWHVGESNLAVDLTVGIDASNLRRGGGVTHLIEILRAAEPAQQGISKVIVFGGTSTLAQLDNQPWLVKRALPDLDGGLITRLFWQYFKLTVLLNKENCSILFVPGGSFFSSFRPVVTMSRNLLPFERQEMKRYGFSMMGLKLWLLRFGQTRSLRRADGVIFLTEYAKTAVTQVSGRLNGHVTQISHGLDVRFLSPPKFQKPINEYGPNNPYQILYVSIIDQYKHQWCVVEAVAALRNKGLPLVLSLVGPAYAPALKKLSQSMEKYDPTGTWIQYHGAVNYRELHHMYAQADLGLFASSCENMPNILLETMAAGLPIAASNMGPMPEVLGDAGVYFDPTKPTAIGTAIEALVSSPELRGMNANNSYERVQQFSWKRCAEETFSFLAQIAEQYSAKKYG